MAKISYKATCRKLINEVPYPVTWDHLRWRQAIAGAESSVGLMPVIYGTDALTNRRDGGLILKVRMERRKPPEAIVDGMHRKRIAAIKTTLTKEENFAIYEQVKAEVWNVTPPKIKDVFVKIKGQEVYVFSDTGTAEKSDGVSSPVVQHVPCRPHVGRRGIQRPVYQPPVKRR